MISDDSRLPEFPGVMKAAVASADRFYVTDFMPLRANTIRTLSQGKHVNLTAQEWVTLSNPAVNSIMAITSTAPNLTESYAEEQRPSPAATSTSPLP